MNASEIFIVKVQISIFTTEQKVRALVYNEDKNVHYECEATEELLSHMKGSKKKYFFAWMEGTEIVLDKEAPEQDW